MLVNQRNVSASRQKQVRQIAKPRQSVSSFSFLTDEINFLPYWRKNLYVFPFRVLDYRMLAVNNAAWRLGIRHGEINLHSYHLAAGSEDHETALVGLRR